MWRIFSLSLIHSLNGFHDDEGLRDIQCSDMIGIGQKKGIFFAVCDERYLPDRMKVYVCLLYTSMSDITGEIRFSI